jgi:hypothetical protein
MWMTMPPDVKDVDDKTRISIPRKRFNFNIPDSAVEVLEWE